MFDGWVVLLQKNIYLLPDLGAVIRRNFVELDVRIAN